MPATSRPLTVLQERHAADHQALVRGYHVEAGAGAADHAGHVVEHVVALGLLLEELHVRVEHVSLGDVDALAEDLGTSGRGRWSGAARARSWVNMRNETSTGRFNPASFTVVNKKEGFRRRGGTGPRNGPPGRARVEQISAFACVPPLRLRSPWVISLSLADWAPR